MLRQLITFLAEIIEGIFPRPAYDISPEKLLMNQPTPDISATNNPDALGTNWENIVIAHHNVRALCDLEGLSYDQKESLTATVCGESEFKIHAKRQNFAFHADGTRYLASTDNGICQWNDFYHGKEITPDEAENNPEKAVRLMCKYWKLGRMNQWVAYSSGRYKQFLGKV